MIVIHSSPASSGPLEFFLAGRGHWAEYAASAKEGLALIDATGDKIIWIDMELPDMNSYELACRIRASRGYEECTLIAIVSAAADEDSRSLIAAGFAHWIHKPIDLRQVQAVLLLRTKRSCIDLEIEPLLSILGAAFSRLGQIEWEAPTDASYRQEVFRQERLSSLK